MSDLRLPDLNKIFLAGRLTRDPELQYLASGTPVCKMGLACSRKYRTKDGDQREETLFINLKAWNKTAEYCGEHLRKGRPVLVEGRLDSDDWEDKNTGQKRTSFEVRIDRINTLDWEDRGGARPSGGSREASEEPEPADDIPF